MPNLLHGGISKGSPSAHLRLGGFSEPEINNVRQLVGHTIGAVERELICATLVKYHGSRTQAAEILDISIRTLRNKIHEYQACGITVSKPSPAPPPIFRRQG